jgi:hypothetical protein
MTRAIGRESLRSGVVCQAYPSRFDLDSQTGAKYSILTVDSKGAFFRPEIAGSTLRKLESRFGPKPEENQAHKTNPKGAR